jgi:phytoene/squalene synthetase
VEFDDDIKACAGMVERGDADRFRTVMGAPVTARPVLFALYAFNVEVARAPWVTQEPMIAEMRLQWWRDVLEEISEGKTPRRHEVVTPLSKILTPGDAKMLDELVAIRRWDIYKDAFEDAAHFERYIDQTSGHLMLVSARRLGTCDEKVVRDVAYAAGVAAWLQAVPKLEEANRIPMVDGRAEAIQELAQSGLDRLTSARNSRQLVSKAARPALWTALGADNVLKQVIANPHVVADGAIQPASGNLAWAALSGRW